MMAWIGFVAVFLVLLWLMARHRLPLPAWIAVLLGADVLLAWMGMPGWLFGLGLLLIVALGAFFGVDELRRQWISRPVMDFLARALPPMSDTERAAIEAGTVGWEGELMRGAPDFTRLHALPEPALSEKEQAFIEGPVEDLCRMLDDWRINESLRDLPPEVWAFLKTHRFFGMVIPEEWGGLAFSAHAHSRVLQKIASRSAAAAVTVMVPNSLGPAELLLNYGTEEQKRRWLPGLASGEEIPCFALTGPFNGSDAGAMPDVGVVCKGEFEGREVLGLRLSWAKRYITLAPVATVLGLAFRVKDPDHLLGDDDEPGITCALIPVDTPGVKIGRRHDPLGIAFMNGPTWGEAVFIPLDWVIGGPEMVGQGWRMLIERLGVGRGISLPSLSVAAGKHAADMTGAYARIREQFHLPVGRFEGVQESLARIGGLTWMMDAAERLTLAMLDAGERPSVVTAMVKRYLTEGMRQVVNDAMDVHGGRGICMGPSNYLGRLYQSLPVAITVEGANILTRSLMVFGQGVMRGHPYLLEEIEAAGEGDLARFDAALSGHLAHSAANAARALLYGLTLAHAAPAPADAGPEARHYRNIARLSAALAILADVALGMLGGAFKRREFLSGRFADALAYLFMASAALKRFADEGRQEEDRAWLDWVCAHCLHEVEAALDGVIRNFPVRPAAWLMRVLALPLGRRLHGPDDALRRELAVRLQEPSASRERLVDGIFRAEDAEDPCGRVRHAWRLALEAEPIRRRLAKAGHRPAPEADHAAWVAEVREQGLVDAKEARLLVRAHKAVEAAIAVDDFAPSTFARRGRSAARRRSTARR
ncbi:MAG: acyl-CoA dehydrogenase [Mariprofundaceae bacterium]